MLWIRIKYRLGLLYKIILFKLGFGKLLLKNRYGERILVYHGIDAIGETRYNSRFISKTLFEAFIKYITTHYNVISLDDFYAEKFKKNTLNIALTFDDGYLNNYKYAVPILKKYNVPACFYVTTIHKKATYLWADYLDLVSFYTAKKSIIFNNNTYIKNAENEFVFSNKSLKIVSKTLTYNQLEEIYKVFEDDWKHISQDKLEDYWKLLSEAQIKEIANHPLFTIGAHGETHTSLTDIPFSQAKQDILTSKEELERICNKPIKEFAFPFGYYNNDLADYCENIGFNRLLLVDYNNNIDSKNDAYKNRFVMNPYITMEQQLAYLLKGTYF